MEDCFLEWLGVELDLVVRGFGLPRDTGRGCSPTGSRRRAWECEWERPSKSSWSRQEVARQPDYDRSPPLPANQQPQPGSTLWWGTEALRERKMMKKMSQILKQTLIRKTIPSWVARNSSNICCSYSTECWLMIGRTCCRVKFNMSNFISSRIRKTSLMKNAKGECEESVYDWTWKRFGPRRGHVEQFGARRGRTWITAQYRRSPTACWSPHRALQNQWDPPPPKHINAM